MTKFLSLFFVLVVSQLSVAQGLTGKLAARDPGHSYLAYKMNATLMSLPLQARNPQDLSAVQAAEKYNKSTLAPAVTWENEQVMQERFEKLRDVRWLTANSRKDFLRRSSWMYPDDGCFARAALANRNLSQWSFPVPNKVFVFGDLSVKTSNSPTGEVSWWYHVAPLVEVGGEKYVLDPSIEPKRPLRLEEWLARQTNDINSLEVAICGSGSYTPYDSCAKITDGEELEAKGDQTYYLDAEWSRLLDLNRNPEQELGDNPPWL